MMDRRDFLKAWGGITILFCVEPFAAMAAEGSGSFQDQPDWNAYLRIEETGRISVFTGKIEMGQGIHVALAQIAAEELRVGLDMIDMVMGDTASCPDDGVTAGSRTMRDVGPRLRRAAAEARAILLELAAEDLEIDESELVLDDGAVAVAADRSRRLPFGRISSGRRIDRYVAGAVEVRPHEDHTISGRPAARRDMDPKVTGAARFAGDVRLPGMRYACLLRPPAHGARLLALDVGEAQEMTGVEVVRDGDLVAVLHEHPDVAERALAAVQAEWSEGDDAPDNATLFDHLAERLQGITESGDPERVAEGEAAAVQVFDQTYRAHYVAHAPIETHAAVALFEADRATVWAASQHPFGTRRQVAEALGLPEESVRIVVPYVGGGFGGKISTDQAVEAARIARLAGVPVHLAWSRKEEFFNDRFRQACKIRVRSGVRPSGEMAFWDADVSYAGSRSTTPVYAAPYRTRVGGPNEAHPLAVGPWRGLGTSVVSFAYEGQVDQMAARAGLDPLSYRLRHITDVRLRDVVTAVADRFGHTFAPAPSGLGVGLACTDYLDTRLAMAARVAVDRDTGGVRVLHVACAMDCGEIINPAGLRQQIEGAVTMGLGYALTEEVRFRGGRVLDENFGTYRIPRFSDAAPVDVVLVDRPDAPPSGAGEPAVTLVGAAVANAIFDATGVRPDTLPMTPERLREGFRGLSQGE